MEPQYLEEIKEIVYKNPFSEVIISKEIKKRGGLNEITDLRDKTAEMLKIPISQVMGITRGWSVEQLYTTLNASLQFINPPALWWKIYNEKKNIYGKRTKQGVFQKVRGQRRQEDQKENGQNSLF